MENSEDTRLSAILPDGGEMGERIRAMGWSGNPLGPISDWPQDLIGAVNLCLASESPQCLLLGPERIQIYNDAYISLLGAMHPQALGQSVTSGVYSTCEKLKPSPSALSAAVPDLLPPKRQWLSMNASTPDKVARILLADNNAETREAMKQLLSPYCEVIAVADGSEALDAARTLLPDVILSDMRMPRMDGFALLAAVRNDATLKTTSVILLSAQAGEEARLAGLQAGADDYLTRPFSARELINRVESNLEQGRIRAEAQLRVFASEARFRTLFAEAPIGMAVLGLQGQFLQVNPACCEMLDYSERELLQMDFTNVREDADLPEAVARFHSLLTGQGSGYVTQTRLKTRQGIPFWVQASVTLVRDGLGQPLHLIGMMENITDRKQADEALKQSEYRFRQMANSLPLVVWMATPTGKITFISRQWESFYGNPVSESLGEDWVRFIHPEDIPSTATLWAESLRTGKYLETEYRVLHQFSGLYRWMLVRAVAIRSEAGEIIAWYGSNTDIHDKKATEVALATQHQLISTITDTASACLFMINRHGHITFMNPAAESVTGYTREEAIGRPMHLLVHHSHPDGTPYPEVDCPLVETYSKGQLSPWHEDIFFRKDGAMFPVTISATPIRNFAGEVSGTVVEFRDTTSEKSTMALIEDYTGRLERSNEELEQFASVASHDLRAPLRKIATFIGALQDRDGTQLSEEGQDYLRRIHHSVDRMQQLITALLSLSSVSRQAKPFAPVSLEDVVNEVLGNLEPFRREVEGTIIVGPLGTIDGDEMQLIQLFQNLIGNALKFHCKDVPPLVRVDARQTRHDCVITVSDNGIGFDMAHAGKIFQVFERLHSPTAYDGTGIGLAVVKKIAARHNGTVTVQSTPQEGSTFTVTLPLKARPQG